LLTVPVVKAVVMVVNKADKPIPKRVSLPSILPPETTDSSACDYDFRCDVCNVHRLFSDMSLF
jgi:hypothetical protein